MKSEQLLSSSAPLHLDSGESSHFVGFDTPDSERTMLLRVVDFGHNGSRAPQRPPMIKLKADSGPSVTLTEFPNAQPIVDPDDHVVGSATWLRKEYDVYLVRISLDRPANNWQIQITNDDSTPHAFQIISLGETRIRNANGAPGSNSLYCGHFPCACTIHEGTPTMACPHCNHYGRPG
ncbi:hypothetical protein GCM10009555_052100 [Acrocarpospora macrocephala]|uniref:Uncharacterized protein n=2 Tax=Acrocarpospora macrocephala TaxID=150177 RepID=A0A5M3WMN9_9ACTN|nr:hypothetical protein [Acrocarpospora macrocephala]GES09332.1 hypothetical protein Amac_029280 [Acrocarpospora macrocephala]